MPSALLTWISSSACLPIISTLYTLILVIIRYVAVATEQHDGSHKYWSLPTDFVGLDILPAGLALMMINQLYRYRKRLAESADQQEGQQTDRNMITAVHGALAALAFVGMSVVTFIGEMNLAGVGVLLCMLVPLLAIIYIILQIMLSFRASATSSTSGIGTSLSQLRMVVAVGMVADFLFILTIGIQSYSSHLSVFYHENLLIRIGYQVMAGLVNVFFLSYIPELKTIELRSMRHRATVANQNQAQTVPNNNVALQDTQCAQGNMQPGTTVPPTYDYGGVVAVADLPPPTYDDAAASTHYPRSGAWETGTGNRHPPRVCIIL